MKSQSDSLAGEHPQTTDEDVLAAFFKVTFPSGSGTCFVVGNGSHFLTAKHVVCDGETPRPGVLIQMGNRTLAPLILPVPDHDVALLVIAEPVHGKPLHLKTAFDYSPNTTLRIPGFPNESLLGTWQTAHIKGPIAGSYEIGFPVQLPAHLGGLSGAPVLSEDNEVIGVFVSHTQEVSDRAAFVPTNRFNALLDFSITPPNTLRALVFLSETGTDKQSQLTTSLEAALTIAGGTLYLGHTCETVFVNDCFVDRDSDKFAATVRQLCTADVVVFDLTSYEPAMMILLGIRSAVRRGVTIGSTSSQRNAATWTEAPFNIKELNAFSHHGPKIGGQLLEDVLSERIVYGVNALAKSTRYCDSVCYGAVRYLLPDERIPLTAREGALVLCSYDAAYDDQWDYMARAIFSRLRQKFAPSTPKVSRAIDLNLGSGRLASETIYSQIRRADFCIVDWSGWSPSVFFELGVRLAVNPMAPACMFDPSFPALFGRNVPKAQSDLLLVFFKLHKYGTTDPGYEAFATVLNEHLSDKSAGPARQPNTYAIASATADTKSEAASVPVYKELLEAYYALGSNDSSGISNLIYPGNKALLKQAQTAVEERLLAAWEFMNAMGLNSLTEGADTKPVNEAYLDICKLLAPMILNRHPLKAKKMFQAFKRSQKKK